VVDDLVARCRFPAPGATLVCGVSGGADSLALLALAVRAGIDAEAVHVDHGLRPESSSEAEVVARAAAALGARFRSVAVPVGDGPNLEARARMARHRALGPEAALGHTADDQAETVLGNLLRGAGLAGVAAMRPGPRHPILALRRAETARLCRDLGLEPVQDPSNDDLRFRRNRLRHEVLPLLDDVAGRDVVPLLARHADVAASAVDHLLAEAAREVPDPTDARALAGVPPVLAALAVHTWLRRCSEEGHPPDAAAVERVLAVARGEAVATEVAGGWRVERSAQRLALVAPGRDARSAQRPT
jgi:tRNA(Ile)-lysidine synthase